MTLRLRILSVRRFFWTSHSGHSTSTMPYRPQVDDDSNEAISHRAKAIPAPTGPTGVVPDELDVLLGLAERLAGPALTDDVVPDREAEVGQDGQDEQHDPETIADPEADGDDDRECDDEQDRDTGIDQPGDESLHPIGRDATSGHGDRTTVEPAHRLGAADPLGAVPIALGSRGIALGVIPARLHLTIAHPERLPHERLAAIKDLASLGREPAGWRSSPGHHDPHR